MGNPVDACDANVNETNEVYTCPEDQEETEGDEVGAEDYAG